MTTSVTGPTAEKAASVEAASVVGASITPTGELILEMAGGTIINAGPVTSDIRIPVDAVVTLKAFDKPSQDVLVPEWRVEGSTNSSVHTMSGVPLTRGMWSPDAQYIIYVTTAAPYFYVLKRTSDRVFSTLAPLAVEPSSAIANVAWSPDAKFLAMMPSTTPLIYQRAGDVFTKLADTLEVSDGLGRVAFSPAGDFLALANAGTDTNPLNIWRYTSSGVLTRIPLSLTGTRYQGRARCLKWSNSGKYLVLSYDKKVPSPEVERLMAFRVEGGVVTALPDTTFNPLPTKNVNDLAWSPDDRYLAVVSDVASETDWGLHIYKRTGSSFTKLDNPDVRPTNSGSSGPTACCFSPDGRYLMVGDWQSGSYIRTYSVDKYGDKFTAVSSSISAPGSPPFAQLEFAPDGTLLMGVQTGTVASLYQAASPRVRPYEEIFQRATRDI